MRFLLILNLIFTMKTQGLTLLVEGPITVPLGQI